MLSSSAAWLLAVVSVSAVWAYLFFRKGPVVALGAAMAMSFAFPAWMRPEVFGLPFTAQTTVACIAMLGYVLHPRSRIISPLTLLDVCIGLMCLSHIAADSFATGLTPVLPFRAWGEWVLPYVAGRYAIRDRNDLRTIAPWVVGVLVVLGIAACIEAVTKVNPFELVFGDRPVELSGRNAQRLGLKRAFGPTRHAIFLGMLLAVLMPWLVCLWQSFESRRTHIMTMFSGVIALAGMVCTVSRTPLMTVLLTAGLVLALRYKFLRWPFGLTAVVTVIVFLSFPTQVTDAVSRWTGGGDQVRIVDVDDEAAEYSSSRSRLWVVSLYAEALIKAGPTGYGSKVVSVFPPKIPYTQGKSELYDTMKFVDNGYVLLTLRFGWLGGTCLFLLFLTAVMTGLSLHADRPDRLFPGTVACLLAVIACASLLLVWMSYDFGLPILWTMGILSGLVSARTRQRLERNRVFG